MMWSIIIIVVVFIIAQRLQKQKDDRKSEREAAKHALELAQMKWNTAGENNPIELAAAMKAVTEAQETLDSLEQKR
jgi:uncharacterized membrane protein